IIRFLRTSSETQRIDYDRVRDLAKKQKPKIIVAGASAYPRIINFSRFREIAQETGAYFMVDMAHIAGLVATNLHPSPVGEADFITSTTHKTLRGPRGGLILCSEEYGAALDKSVFPGTQGGPLMHIIAAKAVAFEEALRPDFKTYQKQVIHNARVLAEALMDYGFDLVTGGTDNHLILVDLTGKGITGLDAERALGQAGIVANKNAIPFDTKGPKITSGVRLGTPALTTRGMKTEEMRVIAGLINDILISPSNESVIERVHDAVMEICHAFPVYPFLQPS
ncbi:glycine hydroxymethyltransferase, partial [delta proteobacterium NaphS2]